MDSSRINLIEFCAGYCGLSLGLKRVIPDLTTIALCEIEAFAVENLVSKMEAGRIDAAPIWDDIKTFPNHEFHGVVDIITGGYPCQPFSAAGRRLGADDPRHLWPYIRHAIQIIEPRYCFFENVEGHISLGLSTVLSDLEEDGYRTAWGIFSASEIGAPHQRKRVFILAHRQQQGSQGRLSRGEDTKGASQLGHLGCSGPSCGIWPARPRKKQFCWEPPRVLRKKLGNSSGEGSSVGWDQSVGSTGAQPESQRSGSHNPADGQRAAESPMGRDAHGASDRVDHAHLYRSCTNRIDELRLLGNGVVPLVAEKAWRVLIQQLRG